jgi:hypothetical protein
VSDTQTPRAPRPPDIGRRTLTPFGYAVCVAVPLLIAALGFHGEILLADHASAKKELEAAPRFSLPSVVRETTGLVQAPASYSGYTRITDNEEKITVQVPVEWGDI